MGGVQYEQQRTVQCGSWTQAGRDVTEADLKLQFESHCASPKNDVAPGCPCFFYLVFPNKQRTTGSSGPPPRARNMMRNAGSSLPLSLSFFSVQDWACQDAPHAAVFPRRIMELQPKWKKKVLSGTGSRLTAHRLVLHCTATLLPVYSDE